MWTYNYTDYDNDYLVHHGIKGQKWGIRRYQNEDGSLTEAGKKRYGKLIDSYKKQGEGRLYYDVNSLREVKGFKKENKKDFKALQDAKYDYDMAIDRYNIYANEYAKKKAGKPINKLLNKLSTNPNDIEAHSRLTAYMEAGIEFAKTDKGKELASKAAESLSNYKEKSAYYEQKATIFVKNLLGEYGKTPIPGSKAYDTVDKVIRESHLDEMMVVEMLRDAQRGQIDF